MHELPITQDIYQVVMKHAAANGATVVSRVCLEVGELREFVEDVVQKYWDYLSRGSIAAHARIEIIPIPTTVKCKGCCQIYRVDLTDLNSSSCPHCGCEEGTLITGSELRIRGIEITTEGDAA